MAKIEDCDGTFPPYILLNLLYQKKCDPEYMHDTMTQLMNRFTE